jgi:hypothetical protein
MPTILIKIALLTLLWGIVGLYIGRFVNEQKSRAYTKLVSSIVIGILFLQQKITGEDNLDVTCLLLMIVHQFQDFIIYNLYGRTFRKVLDTAINQYIFLAYMLHSFNTHSISCLHAGFILEILYIPIYINLIIDDQRFDPIFVATYDVACKCLEGLLHLLSGRYIMLYFIPMLFKNSDYLLLLMSSFMLIDSFTIPFILLNRAR